MLQNRLEGTMKGPQEKGRRETAMFDNRAGACMRQRAQATVHVLANSQETYTCKRQAGTPGE